jgi:hypothetical protein
VVRLQPRDAAPKSTASTIGALLFAVPLLWPEPDTGAEPVAMSSAMIYVFGTWSALIVLAVLFGAASRGWSRTTGPEPARRPGAEPPDPDRKAG